MHKSLYELLEDINTTEDRACQITKMRTANKYFPVFLQYAFQDHLKMALPEGPAPFKPCDEFNSHTYLWPEIRRLYIFVQHLSPNLTETKRQEQWISLLENVHPKDAELLQNVKDKIWPYENIDRDLVEEAFPREFAE